MTDTKRENKTVVGVTTTTGTKNDRVVIAYLGKDDAVWQVGGLIKNLSEQTRLRIDKIKTAMPNKEAGQDGTVKYSGGREIVCISMEKPDKYWNLTVVEDAVQQDTSKKPSHYTKPATTAEGRQTDLEKSAGQQRGNVLTNAVNIVIAKGVKDYSTALRDIKSVAIDLLKISKELETPTTTTETPQLEAQEPDLGVSDDINPDLGF